MEPERAAVTAGDVVLGPCCEIYEPFGEYALLSNFAFTAIVDDDVIWPTAEHAYQAAKFADNAVRDQILKAKDAPSAKALAWNPKFGSAFLPNWDQRRVEEMRRVLTLKFDQNPAAALVLRSTWPQPILEASTDDSFWGTGAAGDGENTLGHLLEDQRCRLLGRPGLFEPAIPRSGRGGASCTRTAPVRWIGEAVVEGRDPALAYEAFYGVDILRALHEQVSEAPSGKLERHAQLLDSKYADYQWTEDARSVVPHWVDAFRGVIASRLQVPMCTAEVIAIGAGCANEAENLWNWFGQRATLVDWGVLLAANCRRGAPEAAVIRCRAEALSGIADGSKDLYVSMRTFDSAFLDFAAALSEAARVLRPGGLMVISISDGYLTRNGGILRGQIGASGEVDRALPWKKLLEVVQGAGASGFGEISFFDLQTEIGFCAVLGQIYGNDSCYFPPCE